MNNISFSFIIPVYNRPDEIEELLFSFTKQDNFWVYKLNNDIKSPNHLKVEIE